MDDEVEDAWTIARERNSLRARVKKLEAQSLKLEAENRRLRIVVDGYTTRVAMKPADTRDEPKTRQRTRLPTA